MNFYKDNVIKIDYNPVLDAQIDYLNAVGSTDSLTLRTLDITPSDSNTIYVKKTGNDSTAVGTAADPVLTIEHADSLLTASKNYIIILDSGEYTENSHAFSTNCKGIYAALGQKPEIKPKLVNLGTSNFFMETYKDIADIGMNEGAGTGYAQQHVLALSDGNIAVVCGIGATIYFKIFNKNGDVIVDATSTGLVTTTGTRFTACAGNSGFIVVVSGGSNTCPGNIFNNSGGLVASIETPSVAVSDPMAVKNGGTVSTYAIMYTTASGWGLKIVSEDGTEILPFTVKSSKRPYIVYTYGISTIPSGGFAYVCEYFNDGYTPFWGVVSENGTLLYEANIQTFAEWGGCSGDISGDKFTISVLTNQGNLYVAEYSLSDYSTIKSVTLMASLGGNYGTYVATSVMNDGCIAISGGYYASFLKIYSPTWVELYSETYSGMYAKSKYHSITDRFYLIYKGPTGGSYPLYMQIKSGFLTDWWTFSGSITFNGVTFSNEENLVRKYFYISTGTFKTKWCNFTEIKRPSYQDDSLYPLYICDAAVTSAEILNCQVFNNDAGFKITSNSVLVQYNQFFKQLLNSAVKVIGAGSGIIINHNDFLYNYICVELEDNNGSEVIKNNIFYTCLLFAIKAETAVTYSNSVENSESYNATAGTQVIRSNPHYVNDGYVSLEDMDLILKSRELGYRFESPAIGIGDDLENAGSVEYEIADGSQTWTTITVQKDLNGGVELYDDPVGAVENPYSDGSVETFRDSFTEVLRLHWRVSILTDFINLRALYRCSKNTVRIYLDPVSDPGVYGTYTLVYNKLNKFSKMPALTRTGIEDVELIFKRAHDEGEA